MTEQERLIKNSTIKLHGEQTRLKRKLQCCKTFKFKISYSALDSKQKESIKMFFVESKRLYNYILSHVKETGMDVFKLDYKEFKDIKYLDKDHNSTPYHIQYICSSVMQDTIRRMKESISALSRSKKNCHKIGLLKYKTECNSIRLPQYGITHKIVGSKFKIQGIKKPIRVGGLKQLNKYNNIDYTTAELLYDGYDYYISLTCYIDKEINNYKNDIIGLDLGCESTITDSNGQKTKILVGESERLKGLQARLARQQKRSNNWYKTRSLIRKEYNRISNQKADIVNKIVHDIVYNNKIVVTQDDQIHQWHEGFTSRTVQHSALGSIKERIKRYSNVIFLDQWFPTTKHCFDCGSDINITLNERTFICPVCGYRENRDTHAANNMIRFYNQYIQSAGTVDLTPRSKVSYDSYKKLVRQEAQLSLAAK